MAGDADDVKRALQRLLAGPTFVEALGAVVVAKGDGLWPPLPVYVFREERLSHLQFPMAELIIYRTTYAGEMVKEATHEIGVRWTAVADTEARVTQTIERLSGATVAVLWNSVLDTLTQNGPITVTAEDFSPLVPTAVHPFVKSALVQARVPTWR